MANNITSGTTVGLAVSTITFTRWYRNIEIANRSSVDMWARVDGVDPAIAADECFFIPALSFINLSNNFPPPEPALGTTTNTVVKLITATAANYTIAVGV